MGPGVRRDDKSMEACTGLDLSKRKLDVADVGLDRIGLHLEAEIPAHRSMVGFSRSTSPEMTFKPFGPAHIR